MSRVRPVLVAVLLVSTAATAAVAVGDVGAPAEPADGPVVGTSEQSSQVLLLTEAGAASFEEPNVTVTNTLSAGYADLAIDLDVKQVEQRLEATEERSQRREILQNATDRAADRVDTLRARARGAQEAFAAGEITASEYALVLGELHAEAESLSGALGSTSAPGTLYAYAYDNGFSDIGTRIYRLRAQLATVEGPVRERIAEVVHGERDQVRVHVTAGNGVMLSTIDGDQYLREVYRPDNVDSELGGDISDAPAVIQAQYPWVSNHSTSPSIETRGGYAFYYTANYGHGQLEAYIDSTTERVYVERHRQTLRQLPGDTEVNTTANNATLSASRTYTGGPLLVTVENETGGAIDTTVVLNGTDVGGTGDDGRLWLVSPAGEYSVSAVYGFETLQVNVTARPAP